MALDSVCIFSRAVLTALLFKWKFFLHEISQFLQRCVRFDRMEPSDWSKGVITFQSESLLFPPRKRHHAVVSFRGNHGDNFPV